MKRPPGYHFTKALTQNITQKLFTSNFKQLIMSKNVEVKTKFNK